MSSDLVKGVFSPEIQQRVLQLVAELKKLMPFLIDLSPEERRALPKMGDKSRAFVEQCLNVAVQNPDILPRGFDLEEFRRDVELMRTLEPVALALQQCFEWVDDTQMAVRSDAYGSSLLVYQCAKLAGKGGGMDQHLDVLGRRFARNVSRPPEPPAEP
jgi:hypothetical protein